jgi:hypothetical protein
MANDDERLRLLWIIVTCMGRRAFLQKTAPAILTQAAARQARYCLVDYSCPDACGDWLASHHAAHVAGGTAHVVAVPGRTFFHKTVALNRGARAALDAGAAALCFADADTWFAADALEHVALPVCGRHGQRRQHPVADRAPDRQRRRFSPRRRL